MRKILPAVVLLTLLSPLVFADESLDLVNGDFWFNGGADHSDPQGPMRVTATAAELYRAPFDLAHPFASRPEYYRGSLSLTAAFSTAHGFYWVLDNLADLAHPLLSKTDTINQSRTLSSPKQFSVPNGDFTLRIRSFYNYIGYGSYLRHHNEPDSLSSMTVGDLPSGSGFTYTVWEQREHGPTPFDKTSEIDPSMTIDQLASLDFAYQSALVYFDAYFWGDTYTIQFVRDNEKPTFTMAANQPHDVWVASMASVVIKATNAADDKSGVAAAWYQLDGGIWTQAADLLTSGGHTFTFSAEGNHTVSTKLTDNVGFESLVQTMHFMIDGRKPVDPAYSAPVVSSSLLGGKNKVLSLKIDWSGVSDPSPGSGLVSLTSYLSTGGQTPIQQPEVIALPAPGTAASGTKTIAVSDSNRSFAPFTYFVVGKDAAGNQTSSTAVSSTVIPPTLQITDVGAPTVDASGDYSVSLTFNCTPIQFRSYDTAFVSRRSGSPSNPLPSSILTSSSFSPQSIVDPSGSINPAYVLANGSGWTTSGGKLVYYDKIPASSGAGHKSLVYALSTLIQNAPDDGDLTAPVGLPNHQGTAGIQIRDLGGHVAGSPDFQIYADGHAVIAVQGSDPDNDRWAIEADRVTITGALASTKKIGGPVAADPVGGVYPNVEIPLTLRPGTNNLQVYWIEGGDDSASYHSDVIGVTATLNPATGMYSISVTNGYSDPSGGGSAALTRPGDPLNFSVGTGDLTPDQLAQIAWDFGDGSSATGPAVTHAYGQSSAQTSDTFEYPLTVTLPDATGTRLALTVQVQDTQEGDLLVPEVWKGNHLVIGVVRVPAGKSLTVAPDTTVVFEGSLGSGFGQGLLVQGSLDVGNGAILEKLPGQNKGWGSIFVTGTATIGTAEIRDADQGVVVTGGGATSLSGTKLHDNQTGVHIVGDGTTSPVLNVVGAAISNNALYGIKEDAGGRPNLSTTSITSNYRNYYSFDQGLLTIDQINQLNGTPTNTGDTSWGTEE